MADSNEDIEIQEWRIRLRFLADIVFATAMTIMILKLEVPDFGHITSTAELAKFLLKQLSNMWVFLISFVVIAVYWMKHLEHFGVTLKVNQTYIWFQLFFLGLIMLIPFWNSYISLFPENVAIKVFMSLNMVLVGLFSFLSMNYAANPKHRLILDKIPDDAILASKKQILTEPGIAIVAGALAFINSDFWDLAFIMVPILFMAREKLVKVNYFGLLRSKGSQESDN